jgi:hypothetical protein
MVLKSRHFKKQIRNTYNVLKCGAGEGWRSVGLTVCEMRKYYKEERNILHTTERRKTNWIGHILHRNCLLKHISEGKIGVRDRTDRETRKKM